MFRDPLLITPGENATASWSLDLDIINGRCKEVPGAIENVGRQRVAVAAFIIKGSIPGQEDAGADWPLLLTGQSSLIECDNQVKANMERYANASQMAESPYPVYQRSQEGIQISLLALTKPSIVGK